MSDKIYLGNDYICELAPEKTGINSNGMVSGPTGSGKSTTLVLPMLMNNDERSFIVPVNKTGIIKECAPALIDHGYKIEIIDFDGNLSTAGYNPFAYMRTEMDYKDFCDTVITHDKDVKNDQFWRNSAVNELTAFMSMLSLNAEHKADNSVPNLHDLRILYSEFSMSGSSMSSGIHSTLDDYFDYACREYPDSIAARSWKAFANNQANVAKDINSTLYASLQRLLLDEPVRISSDYESFDFRRLGREKVALFIVTSPTRRFLDEYINTMYKFAIAELLDEAHNHPGNRLSVPVHMVFDDFDCGAPIKNFDKYISIFRAAGISTMILLQSESQLIATYGEQQATTIINNCDTYIFLGTNDERTGERIARRLNKPLTQVMALPLGQTIIFRRGSAPVVTERYHTYEDPNYIRYNEGRNDYGIR